MKRLPWLFAAFGLSVARADSDMKYALVPDWIGSAEEHDIDPGQLPFRLRLEASEPTYVLVYDWEPKNQLPGHVHPKVVTIEIRRPGNREFEQLSPTITPLDNGPRFTPRMANSDDSLTLVVALETFLRNLDLSSAKEIECRIRVAAYQYDSNKKKFVVTENLVSSPIFVKVNGNKLVDARADRASFTGPFSLKRDSFFEK